jgi:hypothetical protein
LKLNVENIGDLAIVECEGRIVRSESAFKLRDVVTSQSDAHTSVIELSEVRAIAAAVWECLYSSSDGRAIMTSD